VSRYKLDQALYHTALRKGVTIFAGPKVNDVFFQQDRFLVRTGSRVIAAKVAAGCFGKRSNLDVKWNRKFATQRPGKLGNFIGVKYHIKYPHPAGTIALHNFRDGYCGISRIEDGKSCLCYLTTAANLKQAGNSVTEMERTILGANPNLKKIFTEARFLYDEPLVISQVSFHPKEQVEQHVLMLGDAAGMISPLCGNGMSMAMHAGKIAFDEINKFLAGTQTREAMERNYATVWKKQFARRLQTGRAVQYFFGGNLSTSLFLRSMHAIKPLSRAIIRQTHGVGF
jgi:flavin-dependent dehydrogenase